MNWELLLYIAAGLALAAGGLFVAALGFALAAALGARKEARKDVAEKSPVSVKNWADEGLFWWTRR